MEIERTFSVAEVAGKLSRELDTNVTESRVRNYEIEGLLTVERTGDNNARQFTDDDIEKIKIIIVLVDIGIAKEDIKIYLTEPTNARVVALIADRIGTISKFLPIAKEAVAKKTFKGIK